MIENLIHNRYTIFVTDKKYEGCNYYINGEEYIGTILTTPEWICFDSSCKKQEEMLEVGGSLSDFLFLLYCEQNGLGKPSYSLKYCEEEESLPQGIKIQL